MHWLNALFYLVISINIRYILCYTVPKELTIGGMFKTMTIPYNATKDGTYFYVERNDFGSLQLAAFMLAVQQVNNKTDGYFDFILPNTTLKTSVDINQRMEISYSENANFDAAVSAYSTVLNSDQTTAPLVGKFVSLISFIREQESSKSDHRLLILISFTCRNHQRSRWIRSTNSNRDHQWMGSICTYCYFNASRFQSW